VQLRGDLDVVRGNIYFLVELLSHLPAGDPPQSNDLLMVWQGLGLHTLSKGRVFNLCRTAGAGRVSDKPGDAGAARRAGPARR
jgi:hypothetical protein